MAWKSTTFRQAADGRFTKGDSVPGVASKTGNQATGAKATGGKHGAWAVKGSAFGAQKAAGDAKEASSQAVEKHRSAMSSVILEAKKIAKDHRQTLDSIKDPGLKRSAAR